MFSKQILKNSGDEFVILYHGTEHTVPNGKFEVEEWMGTFIMAFAKKCKLPVTKIGSPEKPWVKAIVEPIIEPVAETKEEETKIEETKEVKKDDAETAPTKRWFGYKI